ncbi:MAG: lipid II:glycine glycyltransferase FemX [Planctomycetota bacterium]|jgi:lipid II:glycine glycyltransferase (peptidoglycan interpeptide bridge formation enzyme)
MISHPLDRMSIDEWHDFAVSHPNATVFHHRNWLRLLVGQYGYRPHVFAIKRGGAVVSAVPFLETRSLSGKRKMISLPFTDWMEVLGGQRQAASEILSGLHQARFQRYHTVVIRTDKPLKRDPITNGWVRHELNTAGPIDQIIARASPAVRRNLRKAARSQLAFERRTDAGAMETFYRLHLMTRRKLGVPIQPWPFFRRLTESILQHNLGFVGIVRRGPDAIAAGVFLTHGRMMTYKYGASHPDALDLRPNDCLFHNAIRLATEEGYPRFDFGISRLEDEGLRRFKRKWGASETAVHSEYIVGGNSQSGSHSLSLSVASLAIRYGPPICCQAIGALFYKYSP